MPIMPNTADIVQWWLWDRFTTAAGANTAGTYRFFSQPIGTAGKTKEDTNLENVSQLPAPQWMNVTHMGFFFAPDTHIIDINALFDDYYYEFWVGQKVYSEGPLQCAPAGAGIYSAHTINNTQINTNGWPSLDNMLDVRLPAGTDLGYDKETGERVIADGNRGITILQNQQFQVRVIGTPFALQGAPAPGLNFMCFLYGTLSRGVQ